MAFRASHLALLLCIFVAGSDAQALSVPVLTAQPIATPAPTTPAAPAKPTPTPTITTVQTPKPTSIVSPVATPTASSTPTPSKTPAAQPPPPPGAGSDKTAIMSVVEISGTGISKFNEALGDKFISAMSKILDVPTSSIAIRNWQSGSRRRSRSLLSDSIVVGSSARMGDGISAAAGVQTLKDADASGKLQSALQGEGLDISSASLQSAVTALPSNSQPFTGSDGTGQGLKLWAIILISVVALLLLALAALCCCRRLFCCCRPKVEEEKLPDMVKFGSAKYGTNPYFHNDQSFRPTRDLQSKSEIPT